MGLGALHSSNKLATKTPQNAENSVTPNFSKQASQSQT